MIIQSKIRNALHRASIDGEAGRIMDGYVQLVGRNLGPTIFNVDHDRLIAGGAWIGAVLTSDTVDEEVPATRRNIPRD